MAGKPAGSRHVGGYHFVIISGKRYASSRLAWFYTYGKWPKRTLLFKNGNNQDFSISNLVEKPEGKFDHKSRKGRSAYHRHYRSKGSAPLRKAQLTYRFNISLDEYRKLLIEQRGVCAICEQPETSALRGKIRRLAVDHNHSTGKVRALLCFRCNAGIGRFRENPEILIRAAAYLREHTLPGNVVPFDKERA